MNVSANIHFNSFSINIRLSSRFENDQTPFIDFLPVCINRKEGASVCIDD